VEFETFMIMSLLYGLVYAPTISLTNSLAFHHLPDRDRDFGRVRVWGGIGWIAAGIAVGHWLGAMHTPVGTEEIVKAAQDAGRADAFRLSSILGVVMGAYCFTLPHTPPITEGVQKNAALEAIGEVKRQPLCTLFLLAVPVSCIHQFYFVYTADFLAGLQRAQASANEIAGSINNLLGVGGGGLMTIGQMMEILVIAAIPFVAKSVSRKGLLAVGLTAYAARMALFAYCGDSMPAVLVGVSLHGFCFGCFIFVAYMVVDEETTSDIRASAQSLFNIVIIGVGIIVGSLVATSVVGKMALEQVVVNGEETDVMNYTTLFSIPMWASVACLALLMLFYPSKSSKGA
jgi:MFS family permease